MAAVERQRDVVTSQEPICQRHIRPHRVYTISDRSPGLLLRVILDLVLSYIPHICPHSNSLQLS